MQWPIVGVYYGNVTENGTAGMMVMTMTIFNQWCNGAGVYYGNVTENGTAGMMVMTMTIFNQWCNDAGVYYGNVTENGTAGMMVMTMTATDYDDLDEGTNAKLKYSIGRSSEKNMQIKLYPFTKHSRFTTRWKHTKMTI